MCQFFALPGFRKYFANTSWLFGSGFFGIPVSLLVGIYVARYLGPERFGLLSYALISVQKAIISYKE